jgi:exopolysaccharide production protein ExoQ
MNKKLEIVERAFTVLSLIFYSGGPLPLILSKGSGEGLLDPTPDPTDYSSLQAMFFLNYFITSVLLLTRWKKSAYVITKEWTIWVLMVICLSSTIWSSIPNQTRARSIALVGTSLFGLYLSSRYNIRDQLKLLAWSFAGIIIMSFMMVILVPDYGTMPIGLHAGSWRGIYNHKNSLGRMMTMAAMVFSFLTIDLKQKTWLPWLGLSFVLLVLCKSSSATINFVMMGSIIPICSILRWRYRLLVPSLIAFFTFSSCFSLWFNENAAAVLGTIGKDPTLTGRTDMWPYIMEMIYKEPWLGYGYNGFWSDWDSPGAYVWRAAKWEPPTSHNGFMDLWVEVGLIGVVVFAIGFVTAFIRGLAWLRVDRSWASFWTLLYLIYLVICNLGESALLNRNDLFWVLYVAISYSLATVSLKSAKVETIEDSG